jgi:hypothetical protein
MISPFVVVVLVVTLVILVCRRVRIGERRPPALGRAVVALGPPSVMTLVSRRNDVVLFPKVCQTYPLTLSLQL